MASHLKGKTDAECRALAGHYYARATRAEKDCKAAQAELQTTKVELDRLRRLADAMLEPST